MDFGSNTDNIQGGGSYSKKSLILVVSAILFLTFFVAAFYVYKNKQDKMREENKIQEAAEQKNIQEAAEQKKIQEELQQLDEIKKRMEENKSSDNSATVITPPSPEVVDQQLKELDEQKKSVGVTESAPQDVQSQLDQLDQLRKESEEITK